MHSTEVCGFFLISQWAERNFGREPEEPLLTLVPSAGSHCWHLISVGIEHGMAVIFCCMPFQTSHNSLSAQTGRVCTPKLSCLLKM